MFFKKLSLKYNLGIELGEIVTCLRGHRNILKRKLVLYPTTQSMLNGNFGISVVHLCQEYFQLYLVSCF